MKTNKLKFTRNVPNKEGYYYFTNFGEHTPVVLEVTKEDGKFYAQDCEFTITVKKKPVTRKQIFKEIDTDATPCSDGYYNGEDMWCYIPMPELPNGKTPRKPSCY